MAIQPRILFIAPPAMKHTSALARSLALAKALDAALHIVAFDSIEGLQAVEWGNTDTQQALLEDVIERHRRWLEACVVSHREHGLKVTTQVVRAEHAVSAILDYVAESKPDWLIKDVHREPLLARVMFTSTDLHLLHRYPGRLHLVSGVINALPRQIMVAVDINPQEGKASGLSDRLVHEGLRLGMQCNAEVHVVFAYGLALADPIQWGHGGGMMVPAALLAEEMYTALQESFEAFAGRHGVDLEHRHMLVGSPKQALLRFAESEGADVIVMGRTDQNVSHTWLGSTVDHVMTRMGSSLLSIR